MSQSTATLLPRMPSFSGAFTGPQIAISFSFPTFFLFFWKLGSIGKEDFLLKMMTNYLLEGSVYSFMHARTISFSKWRPGMPDVECFSIAIFVKIANV